MIKHNIDDIPRQAHLKELWDKIDAINKYLMDNTIIEYRRIDLENGDYIQIKYDVEGVVYDRFDKNDEHMESYGYDLYEEIQSKLK